MCSPGNKGAGEGSEQDETHGSEIVLGEMNTTVSLVGLYTSPDGKYDSL